MNGSVQSLRTSISNLADGSNVYALIESILGACGTALYDYFRELSMV